MVDVPTSDRRVGAGTVLSKGGMVCSISPQAASAGASVLRDGGNRVL